MTWQALWQTEARVDNNPFGVAAFELQPQRGVWVTAIDAFSLNSQLLKTNPKARNQGRQTGRPG